MADEKVDWDAFYRDVGITKKEGTGNLTSRKVNTVAVDPFTGRPLGSSSPPNEVIVKGGTNTGLGYQSGQTFPDSYRLLPTGPLAVAGTPATKAIQTATVPDMRGLPYGLGSRDTVAQNAAGQRVLSALLSRAPQVYGGGGMLAPGVVDPWTGMATPGAKARASSGGSSSSYAAPSSFQGVSSGKTYNVGQTYRRADGSTAVANADGSFTDTKTGKKSTGSSAGKSNVGGNYQSINVGSDGVKRGFNLNTNRLEVIK